MATDGDEPTVIEVSLDLRSSGRDRLAEAGAADDDGAGVMLGGARRAAMGATGSKCISRHRQEARCLMMFSS